MLVAVAIGTAPLRAAAATREYQVDPGLVVQKIRGPINVIVVGNPFRYGWSVTVNQNVVTAPGVDKSLISQGVTAASPAPAASVGPFSIGGTPKASPTPQGQIVINVLANPSGAADASGTCDDETRFDRVERCIRDLATQIDQTVKRDVLASWESVCTAQLEYLALQSRTDSLLESLHFGTPVERVHARNLLATLLGGKPSDEPADPSCAAADRPRGAPPAPNTRRYRYATVASVNAAISRIRPFPTQSIANEQAAVDMLVGAVKAYDKMRIDTETTSDIDQRFLDCALSVIKRNLPPKHTAPDVKTVPLSDADRQTVIAALGKKNSHVCDQTLSGAQTAANPALNGAHRLAVATAALTSLKTQLGAYAAAAPYPTALGHAIDQLGMLQGSVLANVGISRFFVEVPEECNGLYGANRTTTITVTRYANETNSVLVDCPSRVFTTGGFAFGAQPQRTYTAVPTNTSLPAAPPGSPTPPPATIQQTTTFDARPVPVVLLNVRFTPAEGPVDNDFYLSFGVSLNNTNNQQLIPGATIPLDFLGGVSYSLSRQLLITGGMMFGPETTIAPGYNVGDPISSSATTVVPTVTRNRAKPFLAITYGPH